MIGAVLTAWTLLAGACVTPPQTRGQDAEKEVDSLPASSLSVRVTKLDDTPALPVIESGVVEQDGWVFLLGGMTPDFNATPAIQRRRPEGDWLPVGSQMGEARINPEALALPDGRILVWGGYGGSAKSSLTLRLDGEIIQPRIAGETKPIDPPEGHSWVTPSPPRLLADGTVALIAESALHRFDVMQHRWLEPDLLGRPLSAATLEVLQDGTLVACGTNPEDGRLVVLQRTPNDAHWESWSLPDDARTLGARSRVLPDDRILLLGWPGTDGRPRPETLIIEPARRMVIEGPELPFDGGIPTWLHAIKVPNGVFVLASEQPTTNELAIPTAIFMQASEDGDLRIWRIDTLPPRRRPNALSTGPGELELFGGYRFSTSGASMANGTTRVKYGTDLNGD